MLPVQAVKPICAPTFLSTGFVRSHEFDQLALRKEELLHELAASRCVDHVAEARGLTISVGICRGNGHHIALCKSEYCEDTLSRSACRAPFA